MKQSIVLCIGTGRCGLASLAKILNQQPDAVCSFDEPPLLPWTCRDTPSPLAPFPKGEGTDDTTRLLKGEGSRTWVIRERFARFRLHGKGRILGDAASFYLPYIDEAIAAEPEIRIVCLKRPREEVVASFCQWLDRTTPLPTNHWAKVPAPGWHHDPVRTRIYPQYDTQDRQEGIRRYWDEYYQHVEEWIGRFPDHICLFDTYDALNTEAGLRDLLGFVGIPPERQVLAVGTNVDNPPARMRTPRQLSDNPMDPRRCAILVPFASYIMPACERALQELERRGYPVRRVGGYAAIDQGRNQMATDALLDGFEETMWIDADVDFHPDSIDRLRSHRLPISAGIYPQKGKRALASHVIPGAPKMVFGRDGGLVEILYAGAGFLHIRREVYLTMQQRLALPMCNERFRIPLIPFFHPMLHECEDGHWYLAEDYAFCERARQCGFKVMADTTIRLWHIGNQAYGWEDAGMERERFDTFVLNFGPKPDPAQAKVGDDNPALTEFARRHAWPSERPKVPPFPQRDWLASGTQAMLSDSVTPATRLIVEVGSWVGRSTRYLANLAPRATIIAVDHWQGSPEHQEDPELAAALPRLHETFLSECWDYRNQIIPLKADSVEGLKRIADAGLQPDLVYLDGDHSFESVLGDVRAALDLFPTAAIVGDDWNWEGVRTAVQNVVADSGLRCESHGPGWRIVK
jgi:hypothetical protein